MGKRSARIAVALMIAAAGLSGAAIGSEGPYAHLFANEERPLTNSEKQVIQNYFRAMYGKSGLFSIDRAVFHYPAIRLEYAKATHAYTGFAIYCGSVNANADTSGNISDVPDIFAVHLNVEHGKVVGVMWGDIVHARRSDLEDIARSYGPSCAAEP